MANKKRVKTKIGDVFSISLAPDKAGYGQVIAGERIVFYMVAFDYTTAVIREPDLEAITGSPIVFAGNFMDGFIKRGNWQVVGNKTPLPFTG